MDGTSEDGGAVGSMVRAAVSRKWNMLYSPANNAEHDGDDHDPAAKSAARAQQPAAENDEPSRAHHTEASLNAIIDGINRAKYLFGKKEHLLKNRTRFSPIIS